MFIWLYFHGIHLLQASDLINIAGLIIGLALCMLALWKSAHHRTTSLRSLILVHVLWAVVFSWYYFNRFPVAEVREMYILPSGSSGQELPKQAAVSIVIFIIWICIFSLGPIIKALDDRHGSRAGYET